MSDDERGTDDHGTVEIEEERLQEQFAAVPYTILRYKGISVAAKLTYAVLIMYARQKGSCFPGQQRMADDMGTSRRSVIAYLQELRKVGLVRVKRRGLGKTNVYVLARWVQPASSEESAHPGVTKNARTVVQDPAFKEEAIKKKKNKGTGAPVVAPALSPSLDLNRVPLEQQKALRTQGTYGKMVQY